MDLIKLVIVFAVVIGLVANKKSMSTAVIIGSIACWILYKIPANIGAITVAPVFVNIHPCYSVVPKVSSSAE